MNKFIRFIDSDGFMACVLAAGPLAGILIAHPTMEGLRIAALTMMIYALGAVIFAAWGWYARRA